MTNSLLRESELQRMSVDICLNLYTSSQPVSQTGSLGLPSLPFVGLQVISLQKWPPTKFWIHFLICLIQADKNGYQTEKPGRYVVFVVNTSEPLTHMMMQ